VKRIVLTHALTGLRLLSRFLRNNVK